jgi:crotonobetainyl-CoA:carnitine CoA-transferase CaiB-like acyl-CoA transferase
VDYEAVSRINPKIIYCSITGYGQTGPYRDTAGHDVNYLSVAGVLDLIGPKEGPPSIPGIQIADMAGGGLYAAVGILSALHARSITGKGQFIDISMTDGSMTLLSLVLGLARLTGGPVERSDSFLSHRYACYHVYETADHRYLSIGAVENRFWKNLCDYFGVPEYTPLQYDDARRQELIGFMEQQFRQKTLSQWEHELAELDICWGPVRTLEEAMASPLFRAREMVVEIPEKNGGVSRGIGIPIKMSDTPGSIRTPPPGFGENTAEVLRSFGYTDENIKQWESSGII